MIKTADARFTTEMEATYVQKWLDERLFDIVTELRKDGKSYYMTNGPPYASGKLHIGTALNWVLKDTIIKSKNMFGYSTFARPGFDTHGLPIELKVQRALNLTDKAKIEEFGVKKFIDECKKFAIGNKDVMIDDIKNLGAVSFDWENPYITYDSDYMFSSWEVIKKADERGLLYLGKYPIHVCPSCQSTAANAEIIYRELDDNSIFIRFPIKGKINEFLLIWTTTPWTLPANTGVMIHPKEYYARVKHKDEILIIAKELVDSVMEKSGIQKGDYEIESELYGENLVGLIYESPLKEVLNIGELQGGYRVIPSERYVTLDTGTGLVHTAPGHGPEDYDEGINNGLPLLSPVKMNGEMTEEAGKFAGMNVFEANEKVTAYLSEKGYLFHQEKVKHDYPCCWRCEGKLIMISLPNWFIKMTDLKEQRLEANDNIVWIPSFAKARFKDFVENSKDWPVSRQRYWGIPLPIWICEKCGNRKVIGSKSEFLEITGLPEDFDPHIPQIDEVKLKCDCGGTMSRVPEIADVWFDSSVASWACLDYTGDKTLFEKYWPADLNVEARDQIRGWWTSQMSSSMVLFDKSPYKEVLMHGFCMQEAGVKMSKSKGGMTPDAMIEKYGRDALRFYYITLSPGADFIFNEDDVKEAKRMLDILWNTYKFATTYMSLDNFDPNKDYKTEFLSEDLWILSRLNSLVKEVLELYKQDAYEKVTRPVKEFIVEDFSRWYVKLARSRVWNEGDDPQKIAVYKTMYDVLTKVSRILSPICPFITEELYQNLEFGKTEEAESIHLTLFPSVEEGLINSELEKEMLFAQKVVDAALSARVEAKVKLRWPIKELKIVTKEKDAKSALKNVKEIIASQVNAKDVIVSTMDGDENHVSSQVTGFKDTIVLVPKELDEEMYAEAMAREVIRRIQQIRKDNKLQENDLIVSEIAADDKFLKYIKSHVELIKKETRSSEFRLSESKTLEGTTKDDNIEGIPVTVTINK
ncbi:MAG: isoleucine--tRNA ligase [Candidatus Diapherotrites archaeon]|nr:isoleucine--tRNA ligase [Candidatus Diapherotrites archaeon]